MLLLLTLARETFQTLQLLDVACRARASRAKVNFLSHHSAIKSLFLPLNTELQISSSSPSTRPGMKVTACFLSPQTWKESVIFKWQLLAVDIEVSSVSSKYRPADETRKSSQVMYSSNTSHIFHKQTPNG